MLEKKEKEFLLCSSGPGRRAGKLPPFLSPKWISHHHESPKSLLQALPSQQLCSQTSPHFSLGTPLFLGRFWGCFSCTEHLSLFSSKPCAHLDLPRAGQRIFPLGFPAGPPQFPAQPQGMPGLSASPMPGEWCPPGPALIRHSKPWKWLQCSLIGIITSHNVF